jgi:DNA polymerase I-like protein with 3'-5' exonuclease and polymerase domains
LGEQLRKALKPEPGTVFIAMNYASLEMRMYAEFGGEHDRHEARVNDCPMCAAGIPKRKATGP